MRSELNLPTVRPHNDGNISVQKLESGGKEYDALVDNSSASIEYVNDEKSGRNYSTILKEFGEIAEKYIK